MNYSFLICVCLFAYILPSKSQNDSLPDYINSQILTEEYSAIQSTLFKEYNTIKKKTINLNHATYNEISYLKILSPKQLTNFFEHIKRNGKLIHLSELQTITGFSKSTIDKLTQAVYIDNNEVAFKHSSQSFFTKPEQLILFRTDRILQKKEGFKGDNFIGDQYRYYFKYQYRTKSLTAGITTEKDAGEKMNFQKLISNFYL